ncbi:MAG: hypothetical protein M1297_09595 [Nitrospirae bacterium]|nr:hypothetical protein [Nitrospirota bacterium]
MSQFGVNQMANLDNPLPGARSTPRPHEEAVTLRREMPARPRPEESEPSPVPPDRSGGGEGRRLDFYA